jgi:hypothetical protein
VLNKSSLNWEYCWTFSFFYSLQDDHVICNMYM